MEGWFTTQEAAKALAVSGSRIRAMVADGLLIGEKRGRDLVVSTLSVGAQKSAYGQLTTAMRIRVLVRDGLTCRECGLRDEDPSSFHVHHVVARADGGTNDIGNLVTLCCDCHRELHGTRDPEDEGSKRYSMRLQSEARFALEDLAQQAGCTMTAVVERLVIAAHASGPPREILNDGVLPGRMEGTVAQSYQNPAAIPGVSQGMPTGGEQRGWLPCRHCGLAEQIHPKTSPWRACRGCQGDGHSNFSDCGRCLRRAAAEKLAKQSTAADTSNMDFDHDWGP